MNKGLWIFGCVLGLAVVGCAPKNVVTLKRDAAPVTPVSGYYERKEEGYSIWVPDSYEVPKDPGMSTSDLQNLSNPVVGYGMGNGQESSTAGAKLVLQDKNYKPIPGEPSTGLTVNVETKGGGADLEGEFKKLTDGIMNEETAKLDLAIGPVYEIKSRTKMVTGDEVWRIHYLICDGEKVYHLEFTTTNGADAINQIAPNVAGSFRVN
ncbi:MAG: hypothetical protein KF824_06790 [Fimbriimonadaceae bacterium]|nr:MAG: hypothetical protein KF824_06790 [Fimbriimonadaceae bacterium]